MKKIIGLRCDVDFGIDFIKGIPFLLNELKKRKLKITFFITMGPDSFKKCTNRVKEKGYLKRIINFNPIKIIKTFGVQYLLNQFFKSNNYVGIAFPNIIKDIINDGHEIGIHGYDHYWWAENIYSATNKEIKNDMNKSFEALNKITKKKKIIWASPNWRCNQNVIEEIDKKKNLYGADCRGSKPFFPKFKNYKSKTIQYPISLPCLHEIKNYVNDKSFENIKKEFFKKIQKDYNLWCIHPYYEGILEKELFVQTLNDLIKENYKICSMKKIHNFWKNKKIAYRSIIKKKLKGGRGLISFA